jgi:thioredoxin 1
MTELNYVTEATFQSEVVDSAQPVLVDVTAVWCGPCRMLEPVLHQVAEEWQDKVKVVKLDADANPNVLMKFGIFGVPTLMLFKGGKIKERVTGFVSKEMLRARLLAHL